MATTFSGPWFDERAPATIHNYCDWAEETVAKEADRRVHERLSSVLRHPTGHYESTVTAERSGTSWQVDGQGVVYAWWLEGTGSRNTPKTRFSGYHTFRTVTEEMQSNATESVDPIPERFMAELNR